MIMLQYFARYRETLGTGQEQLPWSDSLSTVREVRDQLAARGDAWAVLNESRLMCARNQEMCALDEPVRDGDEIAFFPPVTGG
ncbi:molybdopterin converting factor subunit 1 [Halopseudomonas nanhaiensis]|uniref:molybdopterin converting factor subunit 1 n=1 Tax=Halopseudomonas nanhaiensis TaxID=2830842 RepID=UPI001CBE9779|nr:molybdopterin converting factor subunit 1 [Halopseudomonas nanhaiensis]UAW99332.1 molybdopterin converting factor subunit 1 [Halopseudomonas nanhaiensis]